MHSDILEKHISLPLSTQDLEQISISELSSSDLKSANRRVILLPTVSDLFIVVARPAIHGVEIGHSSR